MNILEINNSGNTGKTTLRKHMFVPLMGPNVTSVSIENVNTGDGETNQEISSKQFKSLAVQLNIADEDENFVIDCGASNVEKVLQRMAELTETRNAIDFWVVPAVPQRKQVQDSALTIRSLLDIGVPAEKIIIIFNNITDVDKVVEDFSSLFVFEKIGVHIASQGVLSSEIFESLKGLNDSVFDIAAQVLDKQALKNATLEASGGVKDLTEWARIGELFVLFDMATNASRNLTAVFQSTPIYAGLQAMKAKSEALAD